MAERNRVTTDEIPEQTMKIWVCTDHDKAQNEAKVASIVLAYNKDQAKKLLDAALLSAGLRGYDMWRYRLSEIDQSRPMAEVLNDGDY